MRRGSSIAVSSYRRVAKCPIDVLLSTLYYYGMEQSLDAMKVALRVLTSLTEKRPPAHSDLDSLHRFAPALVHLPADELACEVIQQALRRRAAMRAGQ